MRRYLLALLLSVLLFTVVAAHTRRPTLLDSVAPLSWTEISYYTGEPEMGNHCTIWSLNDRVGYWATAAHCVLTADGQAVMDRDYHIGDAVAVPVAVDGVLDVAVMRSSAIAPALKLAADMGPDWSDEVNSAGYPFGLPEPLIFSGRFIGYEHFVDFPEREFLIFSLAGAPGNSGSPILHDGKVISVWQIGFTPFGAFAGGVQTEEMYAFLAPYAAQ